MYYADPNIGSTILVFSNGTARVSISLERFKLLVVQLIDDGKEYLRGTGKTDNNECADLFEKYQKCLTVCVPSPEIRAQPC